MAQQNTNLLYFAGSSVDQVLVLIIQTGESYRVSALTPLNHIYRIVLFILPINYPLFWGNLFGSLKPGWRQASYS